MYPRSRKTDIFSYYGDVNQSFLQREDLQIMRFSLLSGYLNAILSKQLNFVEWECNMQ